MTHTHADRLREIAHEMLALADALAGATAAPVVESPDQDDEVIRTPAPKQCTGHTRKAVSGHGRDAAGHE